MARRRSWWVKAISGLAALVIMGGAFTAYQVTHRGAPSFRRGGAFVGGSRPGDGLDAAGAGNSAPGNGAAIGGNAPATSPLTSATSAPTVTTRSGPGRPSSSAPSITTSTAPAAGPTVTTRAGVTPSPPPAAPQAAAPAPAPPPGRPALGTYTYAVDGEEVASVFGTRRFPESMTLALHGADDLTPDQLAADSRYSEVHEEREIVGFRGGAVYSDFQGGSVSYGPVTQTAEGDLDPPSLTIPETLAPGLTRTGVTFYKDSHGTVTNTLDWTVTVVGQEQVPVAGVAVTTWRVDIRRTSRPGSSDQVDRQRTVWFDPHRAWWVRYTEKTHASRRTLGGTLTYDAHLTATMTGFTASLTER